MENVGKRLKWVRSKLDLTIKEAAEGSNTTLNKIHYWENINPRVTSHGFYRLLDFYNTMWIRKFPGVAPKFEGRPIEFINIYFILDGKDDLLDKLEEFNTNIVTNLRKEIVDLIMTNEELKQRIEKLEAREMQA